MKLFAKSSTPRTTLLAIVQSEGVSSTIETAVVQFPDLDARVKHAEDSLGDGSRLVNGSADIVMIEADLRDQRALPLLRKLSEYVGVNGRLVVLARNADASNVRDMFRSGVDDVLELPLSAQDVVQSISGALSRPTGRGGRALGRVISVLKCGGGVGATMVAVNAAHNIASRRKVVSGTAPRTLVIDLDPQFGAVASVTSAEARVTVLDLVRKGDAFDMSSLETAVHTIGPDLDILASPSEIVPLSALSVDFLARLVAAARANYDYIVLDHSFNWSAGTASLLKISDLILPIATPCVEHATSASTIMQGLDELEVPREKTLFVHNRVQGTSHKERIHSMDALTQRPSVQIPEEAKVHRAARNHGRLLADTSGSKNQIKAITRLVDRMFEMMNTPVSTDMTPRGVAGEAEAATARG